MNNGKIYKGLIALIGLIVVNAGIFLLIHEYSLTFWISYGFLMVSILLNIAVYVFAAGKQPLLFGYSLGAIAGVYLAAECVAAVIFFVLSPFLTLAAFIVQVLILVAFGICYIQVLMMSSATAKQQEIRGRDIMKFKHILEQMQSVQRKVPYAAAYRKTIEHAGDSLASGQVKSTAEAEQIEGAILDQIRLLDKAVETKNEAAIEESCREIERLSEERKQVLHMRAPF